MDFCVCKPADSVFDCSAIDGSRARAETYLYRIHHAQEGDPASPWSDGALRWLDELVREPSGWRIARREVADNRVHPAV